MSKTLNASWSAEAGATGYQAEYKVAGGIWTPMYSGTGLSASVTVFADGVASVRARALKGTTVGPWAEQSINISGAGTALGVGLSATGISASSAQPTVSTRSVIAQPSGGVRPYSYSWERLTGGRISMLSPGAQSCAFSGQLAEGETVSEQFRCRVTDAAGATAQSPTLTVSLTRSASVLPDITGFDLTDEPELAPELQDGIGVFVWEPVTDPAVSGVQLRHSPLLSGAVWADGKVVAQLAATDVSFKSALLQGTYMIKATGASGAESVNAAAYVYEPLSAAQLEGLRVMPIGTPIPWPLDTAPPGDRYVLMAGQTLDDEDYPELAEFYGSSGGTFTVADWRGKPLWGAADGETPGDVLGQDFIDLMHTHAAGTLGLADHSHGAGSLEAAAHSHGDGTLQAASHTHIVTVPGTSAGDGGTLGTVGDDGNYVSGASGALDVSGSTASSGPHAVSGTTAPAGAATATGSTADATWANTDGQLAAPAAVDKRPQRVLVAWYQRARV